MRARKKFARDGVEIRAIAPGHGWCMATDRIMVDGLPVGYMYRESPRDLRDSGWRFFAGDEDAAYTSDPDRFGIYDVNTIANYDGGIVRHLASPAGSAFVRERASDELVEDPRGAPAREW